MRNPVTDSELDAEWLTAALASRSDGSTVTSVRSEPIAASAALFSGPDRIYLTWDRDGLPTQLVAKAVAESHAASGLGAAMSLFEREAGFYAELAQGCGVRTPKLWFTWATPASMMLILEDLEPLRSGDARDELAIDDVVAALAALAGMHARWWGGAALSEHRFLRRADEHLELIGEQCRALIDNFVARCAIGWSSDEVELVREVAANASSSWRPLFEGDVTLVHGDLAPGNLFFDALEPVFIDWQSAAVASSALDVASILGSGLDAETGRRAQQALIEGYLIALREAGVEADEAEWRQQLRRAAHVMLTPCIAAATAADDRAIRRLEITARRRIDLALSLRQE